jgi:hypothetical protein
MDVCSWPCTAPDIMMNIHFVNSNCLPPLQVIWQEKSQSLGAQFYVLAVCNLFGVAAEGNLVKVRGSVSYKLHVTERKLRIKRLKYCQTKVSKVCVC